MPEYSVPKVTQKKSVLQISTGYWTVEQDINRGGAVVAIRFANGSRRNILKAPVMAYMDRMGDALSFMSAGKRPDCEGENLFSNAFCNKSKIRVNKTAAGYPVIISSGLLRNKKGRTTGISFTEHCEYHSSFLRRTITLNLPEPRKDIFAVGAGKIVVDRSLNEYACKYSARLSKHGDKLLGNIVYGKTEPSVYPAYVESYLFRYLALFRRGSDAIEFLPSSNIEIWEKGVTGSSGSGRFGLYTVEDSEGSTVLMEPYRELTYGYPDPEHSRPELHGTYTFSFTIGLPMIEKTYPSDIRHIGFDNHPWPDEKEIRGWAELGINAARLHNDFHESGNFWHDGTFPPYGEEENKKMKETIETAHRYGIKVIPYFSLHELHPSSEAWKKNHIGWKRTQDDTDTELHNYWKNGEFGAQMCMASGWNEYLKSYIKKVVETYGFDGVYYDWVSPLYCNNLRHKDYEHFTNDELLEFLEWTRGFLGSEKIFVIHTSGSPFMAAESYADATIVFEEIYAPPALVKEVPEVDCFQPQLDMANHIQKLVCPGILAFKGIESESARKFVANCMAMGLISYLGRNISGRNPFIDNFRRLRKYRLQDYKILPFNRAPVRIDNKNLRVCLFFNNREIVIIIANVMSSGKESFSMAFDPSNINPAWSRHSKYVLINEGGDKKIISKFNKTMLTGKIGGYAYAIWNIKPSLKK